MLSLVLWMLQHREPQDKSFPTFGGSQPDSVPAALRAAPQGGSPTAASNLASSAPPAIYPLTTDGQTAASAVDPPARDSTIDVPHGGINIMPAGSEDSLPPTPPTAGKRDSTDEAPIVPVAPLSPPSAPTLDQADAISTSDAQASPALEESSPLKRSSLSRGADFNEQAMGTTPHGVDLHAHESPSSDSQVAHAHPEPPPAAEAAVTEAAEGRDNSTTPSNQQPEQHDDEANGYVAGAALGAVAAVAGGATWLSSLVAGGATHDEEDKSATEAVEDTAAVSEGSTEPTAGELLDRSKDLGSARHSEGVTNISPTSSSMLLRYCGSVAHSVFDCCMRSVWIQHVSLWLLICTSGN